MIAFAEQGSSWGSAFNRRNIHRQATLPFSCCPSPILDRRRLAEIRCCPSPSPSRDAGLPKAECVTNVIALERRNTHPEYSDQSVADMVAACKPTPRTYSERVIDDYVTAWTDKADRKVTA